MLDRSPLVLMFLALLAASGCGGGGSSPSSSQGTAPPTDTAAQLDRLAAEEHDTTFRGIITTPPLRHEVAPGLPAETLDKIDTAPEMAPLRDALAASGASRAQIEAAVGAAVLQGSGQPGDADYEDWKAGRAFAVGAARDFMTKLSAAEAAQGVTVDRDRLDAITGLPSLAAMEDL